MRNLIAQSSPFGTIQPPEAVQKYGVLGGSGGGLVQFISNLIVLVTVLGGVWALFNIILAGFALVTSDGDPKKVGQMTEKITTSFIGLLVMVSAPLLAALLGLLIAGRADYFLRPEIFGPGEF